MFTYSLCWHPAFQSRGIIHSRCFPGIGLAGGQKPWWDANKKRFVTAQGAVLALDHHCPENVQNTNRLFQNTNRLFLGTLVGIMIIGILTIGILSLPRASSLRLTAIVTATGLLARSLYQTPFSSSSWLIISLLCLIVYNFPFLVFVASFFCFAGFFEIIE